MGLVHHLIYGIANVLSYYAIQLLLLLAGYHQWAIQYNYMYVFIHAKQFILLTFTLLACRSRSLPVEYETRISPTTFHEEVTH